MIRVRHLSVEDAELLERAKPGLFPHEVEPSRAWSFLAVGVTEAVAAVEGAHVIGFAGGTALMHPTAPPRFLIQDVRVHPDDRRRGIGTELVLRLIDVAENRGCSGVDLCAPDDDFAVNGFLRRMSATRRETTMTLRWGLNDVPA